MDQKWHLVASDQSVPHVNRFDLSNQDKRSLIQNMVPNRFGTKMSEKKKLKHNGDKLAKLFPIVFMKGLYGFFRSKLRHI